MPWSAREQERPVDSGKRWVLEAILTEEGDLPSMPGNFFAVYT